MISPGRRRRIGRSLFVNPGRLTAEPSSDPLYFLDNVADTRTMTKRMGLITLLT